GVKSVVFIIKDRFQLRGSCCCVDLVIGSEENTVGNFLRVIVVPSLDAQLLTRAQLSQDVAKVVFRNSEEYRNRLQLRDADHAAGVGCANDVSFIDEPKPDLSTDRRDNPGIRQL